MPRYFFHVSSGQSGRDDREGTVFPNVTHARQEAISAAGAIFAEDGRGLVGGDTWTMKIMDELGLIVRTIHLTIED